MKNSEVIHEAERNIAEILTALESNLDMRVFTLYVNTARPLIVDIHLRARDGAIVDDALADVESETEAVTA